MFQAQARRAILAAPLLLPMAVAAQGSGPDVVAALERLVAIGGPLGGQVTALVVVDDPAGAWQIGHEPGRDAFVGSAVKSFILAAWLLEVEAGRASLDEPLPVNDSVRSLVSPVLEKLAGSMGARFVLEAMIAHSDNTATDMAIRRVGIDAVRAVIARAALPGEVRVPRSTRGMFSYLAGAAPGVDLGWDGMLAVAEDRLPGSPRPVVNPVETMTASAASLVAWYRRVLSGGLFARAESLAEFKRISAMAGGLAPVVPDDAAVYGKGGSIIWWGQNALAVGAQMVFRGKPATFSVTLNWRGDAAGVPGVTQALVGATRGLMMAVAARMG